MGGAGACQISCQIQWRLRVLEGETIPSSFWGAASFKWTFLPFSGLNLNLTEEGARVRRRLWGGGGCKVSREESRSKEKAKALSRVGAAAGLGNPSLL